MSEETVPEENLGTRPRNVPSPPDRPVGSEEIAELVASVRAGIEDVPEGPQDGARELDDTLDPAGTTQPCRDAGSKDRGSEEAGSEVAGSRTGATPGWGATRATVDPHVESFAESSATASAAGGSSGGTVAGPRGNTHVGSRGAPRRRVGLGAVLREIAIVVVAALAISALVRTFLVQAFWVPSGSMENTLVRNDRILAWKPATPGRGDVVVFHDPADWLVDSPPATGLAGQIQRALVFVGIMPSSSGDDLVKRVIGVGGDTVECCSVDGKIIRNGVELDEPYIYPGDQTDQIRFKVTVPEGRLFVMGDHRSDSADSRFHMESDQGTVPVSSVVGRAVVIMWPPSRWATLPDYQVVTGGR